jgi:hypothetical protein
VGVRRCRTTELNRTRDNLHAGCVHSPRRSHAVIAAVLSEIHRALTPTPDPSPQGGGERAADAVNSRISYAIALPPWDVTFIISDSVVHTRRKVQPARVSIFSLEGISWRARAPVAVRVLEGAPVAAAAGVVV